MLQENCSDQPMVKIPKLNCDVEIKGTSIKGDPATLGEFWSWAYSDIMCNVTRSVLGEYLVSRALDKIDNPRDVWRSFDICYRGKRLEVKTSAFRQGWTQKKDRNTMSFDIRKRQFYWDPELGEQVDMKELRRIPHCYVFCAYVENDKEDAKKISSILDVSKWEFHPIATISIDRLFYDQKNLALSVIRKYREGRPNGYSDLQAQIDVELDIS